MKLIKVYLFISIITVNTSIYSLATELTAGSNLTQNISSALDNATSATQLIERVRVAKLNLDAYIGGEVPSAQELINTLNELGSVFDNAQSLVYGQANYIPYMKPKWKALQTVIDVKKNYDNWTTETYDSIRNTLNSAGLQASKFATEHQRLERFRQLTKNADGRNQMIQVGNNISADMVNQMQKLRQLMITDLRLKSNIATAEQNEKDADRAAVEEYRKVLNPAPTAPSAHNPSAKYNNADLTIYQ